MGAFSDPTTIKCLKGYEKRGFLLQREVNNAEKNCVCGNRMKGVRSGKKGWYDQKADPRMFYPKASLFPRRTY